jgi:hypothetical protein
MNNIFDIFPNGIQINHVSMINCDPNATFNDVAILKYWKKLLFLNWITKPNEFFLQISCFHLLFVMIHIKIKIGIIQQKCLKNDMWKNEKSNCIFLFFY